MGQLADDGAIKKYLSIPWCEQPSGLNVLGRFRVVREFCPGKRPEAESIDILRIACEIAYCILSRPTVGFRGLGGKFRDKFRRRFARLHLAWRCWADARRKSR